MKHKPNERNRTKDVSKAQTSEALELDDVIYFNANSLPLWRVDIVIYCYDDISYGRTYIVPAPNQDVANAIAAGTMLAEPEIGMGYMLHEGGSVSYSTTPVLREKQKGSHQ